MKEVVLITGAKGLIARRLAERLKNDYEIRFLTRHKTYENEYLWDINKGFIDKKALIGVGHLIHLAGANIAEKRWSKERKNEILSSRIKTAELLLKTMETERIKIKSFISASAVGFYGTKTTNKIFTETDQPGDDFLSDVVQQWEQAADRFEDIAAQVVKIRTGVVLTRNGGALSKMVFPIKYGLGAVLGSGNQYMPWIHIDDICATYEFFVRNNASGVYNACSSEQLTNKEVTNKIAVILGKKIILPNVPKSLLRIIFGESAMILLYGSRVSNQKLLDQGFTFQFDNLDGALQNLLLNR